MKIAAFVERAALLLDPNEREVVLGDFAEHHVVPARALVEILGLASRRQLALWRGWRPWVGLTAVALPVGAVLSVSSLSWARWTAIYLWLYVNWWNIAFLTRPLARADFLSTIGTFLLSAAAIASWSWIVGFALGAVSGRTTWAMFLIFAGIVAVATTNARTVADLNSGNGVVFASVMYRDILPAVLRVCAVFVPAALGMSYTARGGYRAIRSAVCLAAAAACAWAAPASGMTRPFGVLMPWAGVVRFSPVMIGAVIAWPVVVGIAAQFSDTRVRES